MIAISSPWMSANSLRASSRILRLTSASAGNMLPVVSKETATWIFLGIGLLLAPPAGDVNVFGGEVTGDAQVCQGENVVGRAGIEPATRDSSGRRSTC